MIKTLKKFFNFCQEKYRKKFYLSIIFGTFQAIFEALKIPAVFVMIDAVIKNNVTSETCIKCLLIMFVSIVGAGLTKNKSSLLQTEAGYGMCAEKRMELAQHFRYLPMGYYSARSIGEVMSVTTNTMQNLENVATMVVMMVCGGIINTAVITIMIFIIDWRIGLITTVGLVLFFFVNNLMINTTSEKSREKLEKDTNLVSNVIEYIQGITEVKTYGLVGKKSRELNKAIEENKKANADMEFSLIPFTTIQDFILKIVGTAMLFFSIMFFIDGSMSLIYCIMMIISSYMIYSNLESAGRYSSLLRTVDISVDRANDILDIEPMDIDGEDIIPDNHNIKAENIEFSYGDKKIIKNISLEIPEKTSVAIVGASGGGKTTLTQILARFWDTDKGSVTLGGRNVKDFSIDSLMKNYSFVFQNVYLFHDTIANNIRFGNPDASMEEVIEASEKACCHNFISALPDGYDTIIGEGGASLSGGEKQRLSIARAILKDSPIIILDEATANVDPENEEELIRAINELTKEKTVIMIAHRLKTVRNADNIIVVDNGTIAQQGTHDELMQQGGIYRKFIESREKAVSWRL